MGWREGEKKHANAERGVLRVLRRQRPAERVRVRRPLPAPRVPSDDGRGVRLDHVPRLPAAVPRRPLRGARAAHDVRRWTDGRDAGGLPARRLQHGRVALADAPCVVRGDRGGGDAAVPRVAPRRRVEAAPARYVVRVVPARVLRGLCVRLTFARRRQKRTVTRAQRPNTPIVAQRSGAADSVSGS